MSKIELKNLKKAHFIGIGGIGMSAIAKMFLLEGKSVTGSDISPSVLIDELERHGAKVAIGEDKRNLPADTDLVVYTIAISKSNPELKEAKKRKTPILSYPEILGLISREKFTIAVSGTHGKTTTTAMIATAMMDAGLDPTVVVGSILKGAGSNFIAGKSNYFLAEACEYKRSFLNLNPNIIVLLDIDNDHLDYYGDISGVQKGFREFIEKLGEDDFLVTDINHPNIRPILKDLTCTVFDYTVVKDDFHLKIPGRHNIENAQAALVAAGILGIPEGKIVRSLADFSGAWRRFEKRGKTSKGALVYDDYAHHPTEIRAALAGARELFPKKNIVVVYQPHLYSRTKDHMKNFGPAFALANKVILAPIYAAREPKDKTISSPILAKEMKKSMKNVVALKDFETIVRHLKSTLRLKDVLITMGAGDVNKVADAMIK